MAKITHTLTTLHRDAFMQPITAMLVDDNETFLMLAGRLLKENFPGELRLVASASRAEVALGQAVALHPGLILIDLIMPEVSGLQVIPQLRELLPGSMIIALSVLNTDGYRDAALGAGADEFMVKSHLGAGLAAILRRMDEAGCAKVMIHGAGAS